MTRTREVAAPRPARRSGRRLGGRAGIGRGEPRAGPGARTDRLRAADGRHPGRARRAVRRVAPRHGGGQAHGRRPRRSQAGGRAARHGRSGTPVPVLRRPRGGRTVEVVGDLARAERIAVVVPGAGVLVDNYWRLLGGARALHKELGDRSAVVAWLGYETPSTVSLAAVTSGRAVGAARELRSFLGELARLKPTARTSSSATPTAASSAPTPPPPRNSPMSSCTAAPAPATTTPPR